MFDLPTSVSIVLLSAIIVAYAGFIVFVGRCMRHSGRDEPIIPRSQVIPFRPLPRHIDRKKKYLVLVSRAKNMGLSIEERS